MEIKKTKLIFKTLRTEAVYNIASAQKNFTLENVSQEELEKQGVITKQSVFKRMP